MKRTTVRIQGFYYLAIGLWPLLHGASYKDVYGHNNADTVLTLIGLLTVCAALSLVIKRYSFLGLCLALSFLYVNMHYLFNGTFSFFVMIDLLAQAAFLGLIAYEAFLRYKKQQGNRFKSDAAVKPLSMDDAMPGDVAKM